MKNLKHQEHQHEPDTDVRISEKHPTGRYSEQHVEESLADFVRRRLGEEFLMWPVDALAGGIYAGDPEKLSVRHAFPRLALLEEQHGSLLWGQLKGGVRRPAGSDEIPRNKARVFSFDKGLQVLPDRLAEKLEGAVTCNTQIESVTRMVPGQNNSSAGWNVTFSSPELQQKSFDVLIYAGTAYGIGNIAFPPDMMPELSMLGSIPHPPVASLTLGFHRSDITHPLDGFGLLVPGVEQLPILGTLFTSSLFPGRAPGNDHVTLTTYLGGMRQPEIAEMSEDRQSGLVCDTLGTLLGVTGKPQFRHRTVWPRAIPQYHLDHQQYLDAMDRIEQNNPRFYLAGNYRTGISVGDTINAAFDLAERIHLNLAEAMQSNVT